MKSHGRASVDADEPLPTLRPLEALRYGRAAGDPSDLLAPPYDVISPAEAAALRERDPHNAVRLVLPEGEVPERYARAADRLEAWIRTGILVADETPGVYVYRQTFTLEGATRTRWSLFAALDLSPLDAGAVLPHEETHAGPKRDRLALTLATRAQLSAVFLSAGDPDGRLLAASRSAADGTPVLAAATPDEVVHHLWRLEAARAEPLLEAATATPLLIADGHHRYETALAVRERLPDAPRAARVLASIASEADPGLVVFPTHRALVTEPPGGSWLEALADAFEVDGPESGAAGAASGRAARDAAGESGELGLVVPGTGERARLRPRPGALEAAGVGRDEARIGSVVFDRLVLTGSLDLTAEGASRRGELTYHRDPDAAAAAAGPRGAVFLLPPVDVTDVRRVATSGRRLPPKSTYFAPKIPSGLLFRRI